MAEEEAAWSVDYAVGSGVGPTEDAIVAAGDGIGTTAPAVVLDAVGVAAITPPARRRGRVAGTGICSMMSGS